MGQPKPKLWIIGSAAGPDAQRLLTGAYDTAAFPPGPLAEIDPGHGPDVLLVSPSDMRKLTAAPAAAAALLDSMGQGACVTDVAGEVLWSNTKYLTYDDRTKAQIAAACRDAILYFQGGPSVGPAHAQATRRVEIGLPDSGKHF